MCQWHVQKMKWRFTHWKSKTTQFFQSVLRLKTICLKFHLNKFDKLMIAYHAIYGWTKAPKKNAIENSWRKNIYKRKWRSVNFNYNHKLKTLLEKLDKGYFASSSYCWILQLWMILKIIIMSLSILSIIFVQNFCQYFW